MPSRLSELDFPFPGVTPSRQKRSRETTAALLKAGAEMLRDRTLDELSIEDLCAAVDATVGSFYGRFESKEVYFNVLLGLAARDGQAMLTGMADNDRLGNAALDAMCRVLVGQIIAWMRRHEGVLRAALQRSDRGPERWSSFKDLAAATSAAATPLFLGAMGKGRRAAKARTIGFGLQTVFGTLVNAILNDPGPLSMRDPEMTSRLSYCLFLQLQAEIEGIDPRIGVKSRAARS
ncbi:MAG TPA: TetR/AcrR family transcriptional regulator [Xanthobacteraceae bacterium]|jgi:AcrR family transcriptional regulator